MQTSRSSTSHAHQGMNVSAAKMIGMGVMPFAGSSRLSALRCREGTRLYGFVVLLNDVRLSGADVIERVADHTGANQRDERNHDRAQPVVLGPHRPIAGAASGCRLTSSMGEARLER